MAKPGNFVDNTPKALHDLPEHLRHLLFRRGWLVSHNPVPHPEEFPFWGKWNDTEIAGWHIITHPETTYASYSRPDGSLTVAILGHCYNPLTMTSDETECLRHLAEVEPESESWWYRVSELTGIYCLVWIDSKGLHFITDPSGIMATYCGKMADGNFVITSHPQLVADIYGLEMSDLARRLLGYKWYYRVMGPYMPADRSAFDEIRRVVPSIAYCYADGNVSHYRFWPLKEVPVYERGSEGYAKMVERASAILAGGARLVLEKWKNPAISLTGGIDSNTTFAAANGLYDHYEAFSYLSAHKETIDVDAARRIAKRFGVKHKVYEVPQDNSELDDFDLKAAILAHNDAYISPLPANELRKRIYLEQNVHNDVEVKSWVSETIRGYWYKHYNRTSMPPLSGRLFRNLYKIFITNRKLAHELDEMFDTYIKDYEYEKIPACFPPADMHYSEVCWGSWGGVNITEMKYCFDITILYNNRLFLETMFSAPLADRISDAHHLELKKFLNKDLFDMGIRVVNMKETTTRARLLNVIFTINSYLPF